MLITVDGTKAHIGDSTPVPYDVIAQVNRLISGMHLATPPELAGSVQCKPCYTEETMRLFATNAIVYRRPGTSSVCMVNLCERHMGIERVFSGNLGYVLHVLPEPVLLGQQYLFALDSEQDRTALERHLAAYPGVLETLLSGAGAPAEPAAAGEDTGETGKPPDPLLSSPPEAAEDVGNGAETETLVASTAPAAPAAREGSAAMTAPRPGGRGSRGSRRRVPVSPLTAEGSSGADTSPDPRRNGSR